jgi:hypothetical protein
MEEDIKYQKYNKLIWLALILFLISAGVILDAIIFKSKQNEAYENREKPEIYQTNDLNDLELRGAVSSVEIYEYNTVLRFGNVEKAGIRSKKRYDFNVYQEVISEYSEINGEFFITRSIEYDSKRRIAQEKSYDYQIDAKSVVESGVTTTKNYYGKRSRLIKKISYDTNGIQIEKTIYHYDKSGRSLGMTTYSGDEFNENVLMKFSREFVSRDSIIKREQNNYYSNKWLVVLDAFGNEIEKWIYKDNGDLELLRQCKYNNQNNIVYSKTKSLIIGEDYITSQFIYNSKGHLLRSIFLTDGVKDIEHSTYTYDAENNWIYRQINYENQTPIIVERLISYFDEETIINGRL